MDEACASDAYVTIGVALFGDDAFRDPNMPRPILKEEIGKFISALVAQIWNKIRKRAGAQYERLQTMKVEIDADFSGASCLSYMTSSIAHVVLYRVQI